VRRGSGDLEASRGEPRHRCIFAQTAQIVPATRAPESGIVAFALLLWGSQPASAQFIQQGSKLVGTGAGQRCIARWSVALSSDGNTALVGGPDDNLENDQATGAAWVFTRSNGAWIQQGQKLVGTGASVNSGQGWSVALSGDGNTALIGRPGDPVFIIDNLYPLARRGCSPAATAYGPNKGRSSSGPAIFTDPTKAMRLRCPATAALPSSAGLSTTTHPA
jgi:hypothetical protein